MKKPKSHDPDIPAVLEMLNGQTLVKFAKRAHLTPSTLYRLRSGKTRSPQHRTLSAIAQVQGLRCYWLKPRGNR
jgi:transcriptional regulator with XRE-family HTH domain